jgi:hypothetical protein
MRFRFSLSFFNRRSLLRLISSAVRGYTLERRYKRQVISRALLTIVTHMKLLTRL